jgi:glycosyltransferase involved in cell wall biosynthesis
VKLAIICGSGYISGKEIMALELAAGLKNAGYDVDVATTLWEAGEFSNRLRTLNVQTHPMRLGYFSATPRLNELRMTADQLIHLPVLYFRYRRFLRDVSPDRIIHTNWQHLLLLLPFLDRTRDLFWVHEIMPNKAQYRKLLTALSRRLSFFVCVSKVVARSILQLGVSPDQVIVIHNGLSNLGTATARPHRTDDTVSVGIMGQIASWKGHEDLLKAFGQVSRQCLIKCELHIFGNDSGAYAKYLRNLASNLDLNEKVKWHGFISDRAEIYDTIDVCVVPSRFDDPLPTVAIEAAMSGLPCIATRKGGLPEIVQDQITGLLVESESPDELARALKRLVEDPDARRRMGEAARQLAHEKFSRARLVTEFADLLEK